MSAMAGPGYVLGVDIGTTSVKVCVFNPENNEIVAQIGKETQSNVPSDQGIDGNKQDVPKIISALNTCVAKLQKNLLQQITKIGICGQMHGVMFWNQDKSWERVEKDNNLVRFDVVQDQVSALYTWQDSRCDPSFLSSLPVPQSHLKVYTGFGNATIFWMAKNKPEKLKRYNRCGTIQDFAVAMLCNLSRPIMSDQNAASWGYFDCVHHRWNEEILKQAGFPISLLPEIKTSGEIAGYLADNWHSIPKGTPIGIALADLQCSVLSTIETNKDAVLNISTSAQIAFVAEDYKPSTGPPSVSTVEYVPYFKNKYLAVAASLNGGNSLATFVKMVQQWTMTLGFSVPQSKVWEKVISLGLEENSVSDLKISPTCLGERHAPNVTASVTNINIGNLELGKVFRALCNGLLVNLHSMMPRDILQNAKITRIVGNGSGLSRNKVLQNEVLNLYKLPLVFTTGGDAAKGAAMAMNLDTVNFK
ncbi:sedoheptulokinase isoform X1 [Tribolium castaneum]|nr:PREDICTED: sedoheptulokinase isoform X1 [Tribolium castaneum]|eukprot:XP_008197907.1 PREDICTED: sedoheptulokinase isoform X1 [Tribolium castaneum]